MNTPICYIFGAGEQTTCNIELGPQDLVIAADGGFDYLEKLGLRADYVLGDFDSVISYHLPSDSIRYPAKKDDTDLMLAVKLGLQKGYSEFAIYGGTGGRLDHTIGNIQVLTYLSKHEAHGILYGEDYTIRVVTNGSLSFSKDCPENSVCGICSVFSLSSESHNVTIRGLEYEVDGVTLTNAFPLGISNSFTGKKAFISVQNGSLAVLCYHTVIL